MTKKQHFFKPINSFRAFSLVEISVVILIIGILIAGVSSGLDLYQDFRLTTAKQLTLNSVVGRINDLNLWLETTSDKSFSANQKYDNQLISNWNDINPVSNFPFSASQVNINRRPRYIKNGLNNLPVVRFEGNDSDINLSDFMNLPDNVIPYGDSEYSVFFVAKKTINNLNRNIVLSGGEFINSSSRSMNIFGYTADSLLTNYWLPTSTMLNSTNASIIEDAFYICEFFYSKQEQMNRSIYINSLMVAQSTLLTRNSSNKNNFIGRRSDYTTNYFDGDLAEIIIFERALTNTERKRVEEYLSDKWGIAIPR